MEKHTRVNFQFDPIQFKVKSRNSSALTNGAWIERTTADIFSKSDGSVIPWYFWKDAGDFVQNGVGFTVFVDDLPASTAFSAFIHEPCLELGIETAEAHRGQGYAYVACSALIDYCLSNGLEPVWACRAENAGSMKLARKLGFMESRRLPYFRLKAATS
jgi:RimJ/RimL family protein N-acetyltransferase